MTFYYKVSTANDSIYVEQVVSAAKCRLVTITGLTNGTEYTVQITARNSAGHSPSWVDVTGTPTSP